MKMAEKYIFFSLKNSKSHNLTFKIEYLLLLQNSPNIYLVQTNYDYQCFIDLIIKFIMSDERKSEEDKEKKDGDQSKHSLDPVKTQDQIYKNNFNYYNMNTLNNHKQTKEIKSLQSHLYSATNGDFNNFFMPNLFGSSNQSNHQDVQFLLNNMYTTLSNQSRLLNYLVEKNEFNIQTTTKIYEQMRSSKKSQTQVSQKFAKSQFKQTNISTDISANDLVSILYGPKTNFKYKLIMDSQITLQKTLYRERNFKLKINLIDQNDKLFPNSNKIPISLALYTVENPPKFLQSNTLGNKMLKGYTELDLIHGTCLFQKIQIKQVTSHYRKGMLFLVAFAKMPSYGHLNDNFTVDYTQIHPLVVDKVIVKAKKSKEEVGKQIIQVKQLEKLESKQMNDDEIRDEY